MKIVARNAYEIRDGVVHMDIGRGFVTVLDLADLPLVVGIRWCAHEKRCAVYASGSIPKDFGGGSVFMHRLIIGVEHPRVYVDHINHDALDNRRMNLRICSQAQNQRNKIKKDGTTSQYLGVSYQAARPELSKRWRAKIDHEGETIHIGYFASEEEAALARDIVAKELFGDFANLNLEDDAA